MAAWGHSAASQRVDTPTEQPTSIMSRGAARLCCAMKPLIES